MSLLPSAAAATAKAPQRATPVAANSGTTSDTAAVAQCQFKVLQNRSAPAQRSLFLRAAGVG